MFSKLFAGRQGDQSKVKNDSQPIRIQALARPTCLGSFYNVMTDDFIDTPISQNDLAPYISTQNCGGNQYEFISDDEIDSKFKKLNIDGRLQCSILAKIVKLEGSAEYLTDEKKSNKTVRVSCIYKLRTKHQSLELFHNDSPFSRFLSPEHARKICSTATHMVTSIIWGANVIAKFEVEKNEETKNKDVSGMLKALINKPGLEIDGSVKVEYGKELKILKDHVKITIFTDVEPNIGRSITNYEEFQAFLRRVPDFIRDKYDDKGIPIECQLYPLALLTDETQVHANGMTREVESILLESVCEIEGSFRDQLRELNDLRDDCLPFGMALEADLEELENSRLELQKGLCKFQDKFQANLLEHRKSGFHSQESNCLDKFLQNFNESDSHPRKIKSQLKPKLDSVKAKLNFLHRFSDLRKNFREKFVMEDDSHQELKRVFKILSKADVYDLLSGTNEIHTFILHINLEALEKYSEDDNKQISFFFDLSLDVKYKEANFYVLDYHTHNRALFESHGSPEGPLVHYYQGKKLMTQDFFNENFDFLTSKLVLCEASGDLDTFKFSNSNCPCFVLYTPQNTNYPGESYTNGMNLDKFKQLKSHEAYMFGILRQRKWNNHKDVENISAVKILVYYQGKLLSNDYIRDSKHTDHLLELFKLGAQLIHPQNLKLMLKDEQRYVIIYSRRLIETDPKRFYSICQQLKKKLEATNLPVWLLDHDELLANKEDYSEFLNGRDSEKSSCEIFYYKYQQLQSYEDIHLSLQKNHSIRNLEEVTIRNMKELMEYKNTKISLLKLDLGNELSDENPCCIRRKLLKIKYERLSFTLSILNTMDDYDFKKISKILIAINNIQDLSLIFDEFVRDNELLPLCRTISRLRTLCSLNIICIRSQEIKDARIIHLSQSLIHLQNLIALRIEMIDSQNITDHEILALCNSVDQLPNVKELFLDFSRCSKVTERSVVRISESASRNLGISSLRLCFQGCEKITDNAIITLSKSLLLLKNLTGLSLWFSGCKLIADNGISELSQSLTQLNKLSRVLLMFEECPEITVTGKEKLQASVLHVEDKHLKL